MRSKKPKRIYRINSNYNKTQETLNVVNMREEKNARLIKFLTSIRVARKES